MTTPSGVALLVQDHDWSTTSFGQTESWSRPLKATVGLVLEQRVPMSIYWGDELSGLYNDAYCAVLGDKHPAAMGASGREVWSELWHILGPVVDEILHGGAASFHEDVGLPMRRHGLLEETFFSVSCSPIMRSDDENDGVGGVLLAWQETTRGVQDHRELDTLRGLCQTAVEAAAPEYACAAAMRVIGQNPDVPFALLYLVDGAALRLVAMHGLGGLPPSMTSMAIDDEVWPFAEANAMGSSRVKTGLPPLIAAPSVLGQPTYSALVAPLKHQRHLYGFLVTGVSPVRPLDARYRSMYRQIADQLVTVIGSAEAEERGRELASAAELARAEAESAARVKDDFLAMLGHELRNPLAPILTALERMQLRGSKESERERAVIQRQVQHLSILVDDLLDVSRLTRGAVELVKARVELGDIVASAVEWSRPLLDERHHVLVTEVPREGLPVDGDVNRLTQVVSNLLNNAARYTPPGGRIVLSAAREGENVTLSLKDNGIGIAPEMQPKVFDHFTQGQQTLARSGGGLGLGLAIVRSLVELHHGSVGAQSDGVGAGSTFTVTLPVAELPPAAPTPLDELAQTEKKPLRVLVVDDNVDLAELLSESLQELGYTTHHVHDGASALAAVAEFRPDVALLDIGLPIMDGYELARRLRALNLASLRLVALSGYGQESDRQLAKQAGFDTHLVKPVDLTRLVAVLSASD